MAFPTIDVLGIVAAPMFATGSRIDRLAVYARGGAGMVGFLLRASLAAEQVVNHVQGSIMTPLVEVTPDRALGREVDREIPPLAAGAKDVEHRVDDIPHIGFSGSPAGGDGNVWLDQSPLRISDVAGIVVYSHAPFYLPRQPYGTVSEHATWIR